MKKNNYISAFTRLKAVLFLTGLRDDDDQMFTWLQHLIHWGGRKALHVTVILAIPF